VAHRQIVRTDADKRSAPLRPGGRLEQVTGALASNHRQTAQPGSPDAFRRFVPRSEGGRRHSRPPRQHRSHQPLRGSEKVRLAHTSTSPASPSSSRPETRGRFPNVGKPGLGHGPAPHLSPADRAIDLVDSQGRTRSPGSRVTPTRAPHTKLGPTRPSWRHLSRLPEGSCDTSTAYPL